MWRKGVTINISHSREFLCPCLTCLKGNFNIFSFADKTQRITKNKGKFTRRRITGAGETEHTSSDYWGSGNVKKTCYWQDAVNLAGLKPVLNHRKWEGPVAKTIRIRMVPGWNKESTQGIQLPRLSEMNCDFFVIIAVWFWSLCCLNLYDGVWTCDPKWDKNHSPSHGRN